MHFQDDIGIIVKTWSKLSSFAKTLVIVSLLMQALSLASIGGEIYEFKGIIIQVINFYHGITQEIVDFLVRYFFVEISLLALDSIILATLFYGAIARGDYLYYKNFDFGLLSFYFLNIYLIIKDANNIDSQMVLGAFLTYSFGIFFTYWHIKRISFDKQSDQVQRLFLTTFSFFFPVFLTLIILIISEGLFRPL